MLGFQTYAQKQKISFKDTLDGKLDASQFLDQVYGFVPLINPVTEPAIGYGASGAMIFVKRKRDENGNALRTPPDIYALGGLYTESNTWGIGGAYLGHWNDDKIRTNILAGYGSVNIDYYRNLPIIGDVKFGMNITAPFFQADISRRLVKAPIFAGLRYSYFGTDVAFDIGNDNEIPGVIEDYLSTSIASLAPILTFDTRDNIFTPNSGLKLDFSWVFNNEAFGGDVNFQRVNFYGIGFTQLSDKLIGGLRLDFQGSSEDTPFYAFPFVNLRGIPAMRYQGNRVYVIETEERYNFTSRWAAVAFGGIGKGVLPDSSWEDSTTAWSAGGGFRYLLARVFNMYGGVDVARGNENWAVYFVIGSNWNRL